MGIVLVGVNYGTSPVAIRERIAFPKEDLPEALKQLAALKGIQEALILSTCNRVELLARAISDDQGVAHLRRFLHDYHSLEHGQLDPFLYEFTSADAIRHLLRVACGLDSMVIGETQILGQIKDAHRTASQVGYLGGALNVWILQVLRAARRIRGETGVAMADWSVSRAAVELARHVFREFAKHTILVVGAGKMSELTARHLCRSGATEVLVTNRTYQRAADIAAQFRGEAIPFEDLPRALARADIVITSTSGTSGFVIHKADVQRALEARCNRSMLLIDIAVPRNVDPSVAGVKNAFLCDIDGLQNILATHRREIADTVRAAEQMVESEVEALSSGHEHREIGPIIATLKNRIELIGFAELERHIRKAATPENRQRLEEMVKRIANKILHPLIVQLKRQAQLSSHGYDFVDTLVLAFSPDHEGMLGHENDSPPSLS